MVFKELGLSLGLPPYNMNTTRLTLYIPGVRVPRASGCWGGKVVREMFGTFANSDLSV